MRSWEQVSVQKSRPRGASLVAAGIFLSRISGLVRDRVFAHYFGNSAAADAFRAAMRIPNFLQNLFGEGVLSASFIPVYAGLLAREEKQEAGRVAGAVFAILAVVSSVLVLLGVLAAPVLIDVIAPGFHGDKRELTVQLVRILFPGAGLLVMSAWCLGILNSHRRFFLSYSVPVIWNASIVGGLVFAGSAATQAELAVVAAWASVIGSAGQFLVQLPVVIRLAPGLRIAFDLGLASVRTVLKNFAPVFVSRGVVQLSAYIDSLLASLLPDGAVSGLAYAQTIYLLPVSLFGMAVSASELPEMASATGSAAEVSAHLRKRLHSGLRRISFFVIPSAAAFLVLGDTIAGAIYQSGKFTRADAVYVWAILAGASVGLLASTGGRLYASAFYALKDTRTPLRFAVLRVTATTILGYLCAIPLPAALGIDPKWGVAGLTVSAGISGWLEFVLLRRALADKLGPIPSLAGYSARLWAAALAGAASGYVIRGTLPGMHPILTACVALVPFAGVYLALCGRENWPQR